VNTHCNSQVPYGTRNLFYQLTHYQLLKGSALRSYLFMAAMNICFEDVRFTEVTGDRILL
jgi:hypothetical protein